MVRCPVRLQRPFETNVIGMDDQIVQTTRVCRGVRGTSSQNTEIHTNGGCRGLEHCSVYVHLPFFVSEKINYIQSRFIEMPDTFLGEK
jgi:hypothetical protein